MQKALNKEVLQNVSDIEKVDCIEQINQLSNL